MGGLGNGGRCVLPLDEILLHLGVGWGEGEIGGKRNSVFCYGSFQQILGSQSVFWINVLPYSDEIFKGQ